MNWEKISHEMNVKRTELLVYNKTQELIPEYKKQYQDLRYKATIPMAWLPV